MSPRDRRLIFNAFTNASANHLSPGMWRHPCDRAGTEFMTFDYWRDLARVAEDAKFDAILLADSFGIPDNYRGSFHPALRHAAQAPKIDPFPVLAGMVGVTSKLGLVVTGSTTYEHPFSFARRLSTIDHLSDGRLGWNVVTSALDSSARAFGLRAQFDHDERYERAEEFLEVVFGLWERSWQIESLTPDRGDDIYLDPNVVVDIDHQGAFYTVKGPHVSPPSPQRTPVLYQAGAHHEVCDSLRKGQKSPSSERGPMRGLGVMSHRSGAMPLQPGVIRTRSRPCCPSRWSPRRRTRKRSKNIASIHITWTGKGR